MFEINSSFYRKAYLVFTVVSALVLTSCSKGGEESGPTSLNRKAVGASAHDLLSASTYKKVVVEIQYAQGYAPTTAAVNNLRNFMERYMNKPGGIILKQAAIPAPGKNAYSANDIAALEDKHRTAYTRNDTIAVYFFFADSHYSEDKNDVKVLGIAYRNTSMALFERTIQDLSGGLGQPERSRLETVVLQHELGHILGLVNAGTPMVQNHQDTPHGRHCTTTSCLMHYTVETGNVVQNLFGGSTPVLDQQCLNDLKANGGK